MTSVVWLKLEHFLQSSSHGHGFPQVHLKEEHAGLIKQIHQEFPLPLDKISGSAEEFPTQTKCNLGLAFPSFPLWVAD